MTRLRPVVYSILCASAIGYLFGVVFAVRAIQMSELQPRLRDMILLTGWVGGTFGLLYGLVGLVGLGIISVFRTIYPAHLSRRTRIYLLSWIALGTAIAVPFLGYYYSSGIDPHVYADADSAWDLVPYWLARVGRWVGFSALTAAVLSFPATWAMTRFFQIEDDDRRLSATRLLVGVPVVIAVTWLVPPLWLRLANGTARAAPESMVPQAAAPAIAPEPALAPVVIVGLDGVTWDVVDPLLAQGRLPNLASLIERGVRAPIRSYEPTSSPLIWTTISTGKPPGQHGVRSQVENRFRGMRSWFFFPPALGFDRVFGRIWEECSILDQVQITSHSRRAKAFWNVLDECGRSVGLVNWRVSWPAETFRGFNVTSHVYPFLERFVESGVIPSDYTDAALLDHLPGALYPPVRRAELQRCLDAASRRAESLAQRSGLAQDLVPEHEVFALEMGMMLLDQAPVDVLGVYFYEIDAIEHAYWKYREPRYFFAVSDQGIERWGGAIDEIHVCTDLMVGEVLAHVPEDAIVILLSDHGHGPVFGEFRRSGGHSHAPPGMLVMSGPGIRSGATLQDPTVYDIFPTLMWLSGFPVERSARGRVLLEAFDEEIVARRPVRSIEAYPPRAGGGREDEKRTSPVDRELLRRLRALGYVG